jgi:hypothetical protein
MIIGPGGNDDILINPLKMSERVPIRITNDLKPWMSAYWMILDHPYMAVTDKEGQYEIADLPYGEHLFKIWHETYGILDKNYSVLIDEPVNQLDPLVFGEK